MHDLEDHILHLEGLLEHLRQQLSSAARSGSERTLQSQIQLAELALYHCRSALEIERKMAMQSSS